MFQAFCFDGLYIASGLYFSQLPRNAPVHVMHIQITCRITVLLCPILLSNIVDVCGCNHIDLIPGPCAIWATSLFPSVCCVSYMMSWQLYGSCMIVTRIMSYDNIFRHAQPIFTSHPLGVSTVPRQLRSILELYGCSGPHVELRVIPRWFLAKEGFGKRSVNSTMVLSVKLSTTQA